jgi:Domain of unknown function (DUF4270)
MRFVFLPMLCSLIICSCESDSSEIGSDFFSNGALDFSYIDSSTVELSTIQVEDLVTSATSRMLVGTHNDKVLGKFTAGSYFQVTPADVPNFEDVTVAYDYFSIVLPLDHYAYYDTLSSLTLRVHRVVEDIETDGGYLYNSSLFQTEGESIGSITFKPRPHNDSVEIKLSDTLGKEIFEKAVNNNDDINSTNFLKYFHGLAILPDTSSSACILGFSTNPKLKVHYIDKSTTPVAKKQLTFDVKTASSLYFTNITCDRRNTSLESMPSGNGRLSSAETNNQSYLHAGAGLSLRIDLPYLRTLKQLTNFYPTKAILEIFPVRRSFNATTKLPSKLTVFKADKRNTIYQEMEMTANLVEDTDLGRDTYYTFDATDFVKAQMELQSLNENALIFTTDKNTFPVSAERIYAAPPSYEYKTRLRIYFATVNR